MKNNAASYALPVLCVAFVPLVDRLLDRPHRLLVSGAMDEVGHVLTALIFGYAARAVRVPVVLPAVAIGALVVDLDHIPLWLDWIEPLPGTSRNVLHSLGVVWICFVLSALWSRHATIWTSLGIGVSSHLCRDLATGTVPLAWPVLTSVKSITYHGYILVLVSLVTISLARGLAILFETRNGTKDGELGAGKIDQLTVRETQHISSFRTQT